MDYIDIIKNILTSSVVVGVATYLIQKRIDKRFNRIEEFQKTLITIKKDRYDTILKTLQEIWEKIVETEYYIRHDLAKQVKIAQEGEQKDLTLDFTPLKDAFIFIQKRKILLTKKLSEITISLFINHLESTYNGYIDALNKAGEGRLTLEELNNFIPTALGDNYKRDLNELKEKFEKQAREILYEEE